VHEHSIGAGSTFAEHLAGSFVGLETLQLQEGALRRIY